MNLYCLMINELKHTIYYSFWNSRVQSKYLCFISCVQNVHHQPRHMHSDVYESLIALLIIVCSNHPRSAAVHFLAAECSWALSELCKMHHTHDSQVGWGLVNLVAIYPLRWSRYRYSWPSASPASDRPCELERRLAGIGIQMEATVCSRQRALVVAFRRNMLHWLWLKTSGT